MWKIEYTKRFLNELAALPKEVQSPIELIVFAELEAENPFELGYLNKMKGYKDKYKIRVGCDRCLGDEGRSFFCGLGGRSPS